MKKNYIIDTNVMLHDPNFLYNFEDNNVIIPLTCIEELDNFKKDNSIIGYNARTVLRNINNLSLNTDNTLFEGITLKNGGTLRIALTENLETLEKGKTNNLNKKNINNLKLKNNKNDNIIINYCFLISNSKNEIKEDLSIKKIEDMETILVTKDTACAIKAKSLGIKVQDYKSDKIEVDTLYDGYEKIYVSDERLDTLNRNKKISIESIKDNLINEKNIPIGIYPNEFLQLISYDTKRNSIVQVKKNELHLINLDNISYKGKLIKPRNKEQKLVYQLLLDDNIPFVSLSSSAGCGKTIITMAVALEKLEQGLYNKIILVRPIVAAGEDIGFLPGTEEEKLKPWMGAFFDAIENILAIKGEQTCAEDYIERLRMEGKLEIKSFTYMRGRTLSNAFVILDEAQEITPHIAKLMLTRIGENTKIVMTGDPSDNQIDNNLVNSKTNGLVYVIDKCKNSELTGHMTLKKVERSPIAELMQQVL